MADTMQFDLVSPESRLASVQATAVQLPGAEGDLTAMANHAPLITTLRPGIVKVTGDDGVKDYAVTGGFAEISPDGVTVLAEMAYTRHADNKRSIEAHLEEARAVEKEATDEHRDGAAKFVADLVQLLDDMD